MQYILLIYGEEAKSQRPPQEPEAFAAYMAPWSAYNAALKDAGVYLGGEALMPTAMATTVTAVSGEPVFTDGPFAETKEQLGGFYLIEVDDLDAALAWAAKCPGTTYGRVEVRPILSLG